MFLAGMVIIFERKFKEVLKYLYLSALNNSKTMTCFYTSLSCTVSLKVTESKKGGDYVK